MFNLRGNRAGGADVRGHPRYLSARSESGFTLVEIMVAMTLGAMMFIAAAATLGGSLAASLSARQNQGATDVASEELEDARSLSFSGLAMNRDDLVDDPLLEFDGTDYWFEVNGEKERIVTVDVGAGVSPHLQTVTRNSTAFQVSTYVTDPGDATGDYRRVTVVLTWTRGSHEHERRFSTFITQTRRGLPLPRFTFRAPVNVTVSPGETAEIPMTLTNVGARDGWNFALTMSPVRTWTWAYYVDDNRNGVHDAGENTLLADTDGNGQIDTGLLETDQVLSFIALTTMAGNETLGQVDVSITATSITQPSSSTASKTLAHRVQVEEGACGACGADSVLYLHNRVDGSGNPINGATAAQEPTMPMTAREPTATSLVNYDTDRDSSQGRYLAKGGSGPTESSQTKRQIWRGSLSAGEVSLNGTVVVRFYAAMKDLQNKKAQMVAYVRTQDSDGTWVSRGNVTAPATFKKWGTDFKEVVFDVPVGAVTVPAGRQVEVTIVVTSGSEDDMWTAFSTTSYPAKANFPVVS